MNLMDRLTTLLAGTNGVIAVAVLALLALLFFVLWLLGRGGGGKGGGDELRRVGNELKIARGDLMQAKHDHTAELTKLNRELENLRAVAAGKMPPELDEWRRKAEAAEARLVSERAELEAQFQKRMEVLEKAVGGGSFDQTVIAPNISAMHERTTALEQELAEAKRQLAEAEGRFQAELKAQFDKLSAEKAAALNSLAERLRAKLPEGQSVADVAAAALAASAGEAPDSIRFPYLEVVEGGAVGTRYYLPYGQSTLGRETSCTIAIDEPRASRLHAEIVFDGTEFVLKDHKSRNGTFLNDKPVETAPLKFGDVIAIGDLKLAFDCAANVASATDAAAAAAAWRAMAASAPRYRAATQALAKAGD
jgi:FHA domain